MVTFHISTFRVAQLGASCPAGWSCSLYGSIRNANAFSFPAPCMALSKTVPASHQGGGFHLSSCLISLYHAIKMHDIFRKRVKSFSSGRQIPGIARAYIVSSAPGPPWKIGCIPLLALMTLITQGFCEQL